MPGKVTEIKGEDGRTWRLRFSLAALGWFERQSGLKVSALTGDRLQNLWLDEIAMLFAAGIYHENRDVTIDDGYEILESLSSEQAQKQLMEALYRDQGIELPPDEAAQVNDSAQTESGTDPKNVSGTGTS